MHQTVVVLMDAKMMFLGFWPKMDPSILDACRRLSVILLLLCALLLILGFRQTQALARGRTLFLAQSRTPTLAQGREISLISSLGLLCLLKVNDQSNHR